MRNEASELIMGYLQGHLTREGEDLFYAWLNEDDEHKKLFFEIKAVYDACRSLESPRDMRVSWGLRINPVVFIFLIKYLSLPHDIR
ncbi:MAG: hypothetical protein PHC95_12670 [Parabacteroides sp.]|nr:hypothetical protein [Parabacteroides sp.]